jgi:hypothetical protein
LDSLRVARPVKSFGGGRQSQSVQLLENGVIVKRFDRSKKHAEKMQSEIKNLKRVANCPFVPHLVAVDEKQRTLYLTNVGKRPKRYTKKLEHEVRKKLHVLETEYHMKRSFGYSRKGLPRLANVAVDKTGKVNLVDMGPPWHKIK